MKRVVQLKEDVVKGVCGERGVMIGGVVKEVDPEADTPQDPEADPPWTQRAVRILLECIFISHYFR